MLLGNRIQALLEPQSALIALQKAFTELKWVLNAGKTKYMFSKSRKNLTGDLCISTLNVACINRVPANTYLGIWFDVKLSFKKHVD